MSKEYAEFKANFSKSFRGYDIEEVLEFIQEMNSSFRDLASRIETLEKRNQELSLELEKYKHLENSMLKAIELADKHQKEWLDVQRRELVKLEKEALEQSDKILKTAQKEAKKQKLIEENALKVKKLQYEQEFLELQRELKGFKIAKKQIIDEITHLKSSTQKKEKVKSKEKTKNKETKPENPSSAKSSNSSTSPKRGRPAKAPAISNLNLKDDGLPTVKKVLEEFNKKGLDSTNIADLS